MQLHFLHRAGAPPLPGNTVVQSCKPCPSVCHVYSFCSFLLYLITSAEVSLESYTKKKKCMALNKQRLLKPPELCPLSLSPSCSLCLTLNFFSLWGFLDHCSSLSPVSEPVMKLLVSVGLCRSVLKPSQNVLFLS